MYRGQWLWSQNSWCFFLLLLRAELSKDIDTLEEGEKLHKVFSEKWLIVIPIEIKKTGWASTTVVRDAISNKILYYIQNSIQQLDQVVP